MPLTKPGPALTGGDHYVIAKARELAAIKDIDALRERQETDDDGTALAFTWGEARFLLGELAAIADRLGGDDA